MILKIFLTLLPVVFLFHLFMTDYRLHKQGIKQDGKPPINKNLFFGSKYAVLIIWLGMILEIWNVHIPGSLARTSFLQIIGLVLWCAGFMFLFTGKFSLGKNFRIGVADEMTQFIADGIYRISRNPMYIGLYLTFFGCIFYSLNIFYSMLSITIIMIHHMITLAEEKQLTVIYGEPYKEYCKQVRRYL